MKEEFHVRFTAILQILYQRKRLTFFNDQITIIFELANRGKLVNWCSIMLTQLLVELIRWIERKKKITTNPISSKTKANINRISE
jgi:hypothetical protein